MRDHILYNRLKIEGINIMKLNPFRFAALKEHIQKSKPHVIMIVEIGNNDRYIGGYNKTQSPVESTGGVAIYTHRNLLVVKTDIMKDMVVVFIRTDKYSLLILINVYVNPIRTDKKEFMENLKDYIGFLRQAYNQVKIVIFGDFNRKRVKVRGGIRVHTHDWTFRRGNTRSRTDFFLCDGPGSETLGHPEPTCFANGDHRLLTLETNIDWTTQRNKRKVPSRKDRMEQGKQALLDHTTAEGFFAEMEKGKEEKLIKVSMIIPKL